VGPGYDSSGLWSASGRRPGPSSLGRPPATDTDGMTRSGSSRLRGQEEARLFRGLVLASRWALVGVTGPDLQLKPSAASPSSPSSTPLWPRAWPFGYVRCEKRAKPSAASPSSPSSTPLWPRAWPFGYVRCEKRAASPSSGGRRQARGAARACCGRGGRRAAWARPGTRLRRGRRGQSSPGKKKNSAITEGTQHGKQVQEL